MAVSNNIVPDGASSSSEIAAQSAASLPNGDFTFMFWVNWYAAISSGGFGVTFDLEMTNGNYIQLGQNAGHDYLELWNGSSAPTNMSSLAITNNKWWHYVLRRVGNIFTVSISDENGATYDVAPGATLTLALPGVFDTIAIMGADDRLQNFKGWARVLTDAEVRIERERSAVCSSADLWINTKLLTRADLTDSSGNGHHWTEVNTLATIAGPTISEAACAGARSGADNSIPCCDQSVPEVGGAGAAGAVPVPFVLNWYRGCTGGGTVEEAADLEEAESWVS